jgi:hypothetical protein
LLNICFVCDTDFWSDDDLIGRVVLPLNVLDLTPGAVNDFLLPVPRAGTKVEEAEEGTTYQHTVRMPSGVIADERDAGLPSPSGAESAATHSANLQRSLSSPFSAAGVSSQASVWSQLAANPMDLLRSKLCKLHVRISYFPLTDQELAAIGREAGRQQRGELEPTSSSANLQGSSRLLRR